MDQFARSLNPYCNGRKNRIVANTFSEFVGGGLNPYCNGRKNRMSFPHHAKHISI